MYLKTDNLGHHEIVDGELSASEKSLPPEYQDAYAHGHLLANALTTHDLKSSKTEKEWLNTHGWSVQMPDPKVPFKAIILTSSNLPKKIRVNVLDEVGHQPHHNYGFSGKKNGVEYFRGKPLSPGWHLDKYGWPTRRPRW